MLAWRRRIAIVSIVLGAKSLHRRPSIDQRTFGRELLSGQRRCDPVALQDHRQPSLDLSVPCLQVHRRIHRKPDKPAKQQVAVQLLHRLTPRAGRGERAKQNRPAAGSQALSRSSRSSNKLPDLRRHDFQGVVHDHADRLQWKIHRYGSRSSNKGTNSQTLDLRLASTTPDNPWRDSNHVHNTGTKNFPNDLQEHDPTGWTRLTGIFLGRGEERLAGDAGQRPRGTPHLLSGPMCPHQVESIWPDSALGRSADYRATLSTTSRPWTQVLRMLFRAAL